MLTAPTFHASVEAKCLIESIFKESVGKLWSTAMVVSGEGKAHPRRQVRCTKVSASEPPRRCRNAKDGVKDGGTRHPLSLAKEERAVTPLLQRCAPSFYPDRLSTSLLEGDPNSGYIVARMRYEIILAPEAIEDLRRLRANIRSAVRVALETHLRYTPTKTSKSRIKRLRGLSRPQFRLRVGEVRVFYDVTEAAVEILAIAPKSQAAAWLE